MDTLHVDTLVLIFLELAPEEILAVINTSKKNPRNI